MQNIQNPLMPVNSPYGGPPTRSPHPGQLGGLNQNAPPQNQYTLNSVQQLFELNPQNYKNFQSFFVVKSSTSEPFWGLVVDQETLDSGVQLEFKSADNGYFSGEIIQDTNNSNNWYLVLKSIKPNVVILDIKTQSIQPQLNITTNPPNTYSELQGQNQNVSQGLEQKDNAKLALTKKDDDKFPLWKIAVIVLLILMMVGGGYYFFKIYYLGKKSDKKIDPLIESLIPPPAAVITPGTSKLRSPSRTILTEPSVASEPVFKQNTEDPIKKNTSPLKNILDPELLARLNNI